MNLKDDYSDSPSDEQLSLRIKRADADAFQHLYHRYFETLFAYLWRRTRDGEVSKDLAQETFLKLWTHRRSLDPAKSIKAYLYRIANNLSIDHQRKQSLEAAYAAREAQLGKAVMQQESPELTEAVHLAIANLPDAIRVVFTLNRFEGLKYREIAETLDISVKTVESRMSKALKILQEKLHPLLLTLLSLHFLR
ncbi:MAG: RNA polymerase sigma-70 factor [bacterium]